VPLLASATQLDFVFNNGAGIWDNNGGADWHFTVTGTQPPNEWTMNGVVDADAVLVAQNAAGNRRVWAGIKGTTLYVATEDAGEGDDVFLFVGAPVGALRTAPWAKSGQVASWSAFLADENDNDYEGWFNALGATFTGAGNPQASTAANGGVVEGTIDLAAYLGSVPAEIALAAGPFATGNAGALKSAQQAPAAIAVNGNIEANEYVVVETCAITVPSPGAAAGTCCPADLDGDGLVGAADLSALLSAWGSTGTAAGAADIDGDGSVGAADLAAPRLSIEGGLEIRGEAGRGVMDRHERIARWRPGPTRGPLLQLLLRFLLKHCVEEPVFDAVHEHRHVHAEQAGHRQREHREGQHQPVAQAMHPCRHASASSLKPTSCTVLSIGRSKGLSSPCRSRYRCERSGSEGGASSPQRRRINSLRVTVRGQASASSTSRR
jgi:hypothetical protein